MCVCAKRRVDLRSEAQEWGGVWVMCAHRNEGAKRRGELVTATRVDLRRDAQEWGGVWVMCAHGFPVTTDNPPPSSSKSSTSLLHPANLNQIITHLNGKFILLNSTAELLEKGAIGGEVGLSPMY